MVETLRLPAALWGKANDSSSAFEEHHMLAVHPGFAAAARLCLEQHLGLGSFAWRDSGSDQPHEPCFAYLPLDSAQGAVIVRLVDDGIRAGRPHHLRLEAAQLGPPLVVPETLVALLHPAAWASCTLSDATHVEAVLTLGPPPPSWRGPLLTTLAGHLNQPLLVAPHRAFSLKQDSPLRVVYITSPTVSFATPPASADPHVTAMPTHAVPTLPLTAFPMEPDKRRGRSRLSLVLIVILASLLVLSTWQWWRLYRESQSLHAQVATLNSALRHAQARHQALVAQTASKQETQQQYDGQISRLQHRIATLSTMNESWQQEARRLGAATPNELRQRLDMLSRAQPEQLTALHQALAQRDALIAEMKHYLQRNNQELQRLYQLLEPPEVPDTSQ